MAKVRDNAVCFDASELDAVRQALGVAADVYKNDGAQMRASGLDCLAAQFERQTAECHRLARFIEECA
jgi:hypothetical protein